MKVYHKHIEVLMKDDCREFRAFFCNEWEKYEGIVVQEIVDDQPGTGVKLIFTVEEAILLSEKLNKFAKAIRAYMKVKELKFSDEDDSPEEDI